VLVAAAAYAVTIAVQWLSIGSEPGEGLAAAAFVVVRFYGYDPYYAPTLRRFSDDGSVAPVWVYGLVLGLVVAAGLIMVRPHVGFPATAILLLVCLGTVFAMGAGH